MERAVSQLPVVDDMRTMRPVGTLTESAVASAYNQAVVRQAIVRQESA